MRHALGIAHIWRFNDDSTVYLQLSTELPPHTIAWESYEVGNTGRERWNQTLKGLVVLSQKERGCAGGCACFCIGGKWLVPMMSGYGKNKQDGENSMRGQPEEPGSISGRGGKTEDTGKI
jgi:hypothetical protein